MGRRHAGGASERGVHGGMRRDDVGVGHLRLLRPNHEHEWLHHQEQGQLGEVLVEQFVEFVGLAAEGGLQTPKSHTVLVDCAASAGGVVEWGG